MVDPIEALVEKMEAIEWHYVKCQHIKERDVEERAKRDTAMERFFDDCKKKWETPTFDTIVQKIAETYELCKNPHSYVTLTSCFVNSVWID